MVGKYYKTKGIFKLIKITEINYFHFRTENISLTERKQKTLKLLLS